MPIKYKQKEIRSRKQCWSETLSKLRYYWQPLNILLYCLLLPKWLSITYYCARIFFYLCNCSWYAAYTIMSISMWITLFIFYYSYKCFWRSDKKIGGSWNGTSRPRGPSFMWLWSRKSSVIPGNKIISIYYLNNSIKIRTYIICASMKFHFLNRLNGIKERMSFIDIRHAKKQNYS